MAATVSNFASSLNLVEGDSPQTLASFTVTGLSGQDIEPVELGFLNLLPLNWSDLNVVLEDASGKQYGTTVSRDDLRGWEVPSGSYTLKVSAVSDNIPEGTETAKLDFRLLDGYDYQAFTTLSIVDPPPNTAPVAKPDSVITPENTAINIPVATLLINDSDANNDPLTITGVSNPQNGTAVLNDNGTPTNYSDDYITFTPTRGFTGNASFNYTISDGKGGTASTAVGVTVNAVNQAPTAVNLLGATTSLPENTPTPTPIKLADISITDDGLGTNTLSLSGSDAGSFTIQNNALYLKAGTTLDYESKAAYNVTVNVDDPTVGNTPDASTNYTLALTNVNEAPVAMGDSVSTSKNTGSPVTSITVDLTKDVKDPDTTATTDGLANATLNVTSTTNGTIASIDQDTRLVTFTPTAGFSGTASFNYTITDAGGLTSNVATVTVDVGDILTTGNKSQDISGNNGNDSISAGNGSDTIHGLGGNDTLMGNNGADVIDGGDGDDLIDGGNGPDTLTGGTGKDTFVLSKSAGGDTITDFTASEDSIHLTGGLSFGQLTISASGSNTLIKLGSDTLATLTGVNSSQISANNFTTV